MLPDILQMMGYGSLALLVLYVLFFVWRTRSKPKTHASTAATSDAHAKALRENSELLRELIAINRKLLEKQERQDA